MKRFFFAALASALCLCAAWTEEPASETAAGPAPSAENPPAFSEWADSVSALLGTTLAEAFERYGVPLEVSSARGEEPWQDDVVFKYGGGLSFFWYKDRVWQLRFGPGFHGNFRDAGMGSSREEIAAALGKPFHAEKNWTLYHFVGRGYPLRLRLFFGDSGLEDIYIYRGDF